MKKRMSLFFMRKLFIYVDKIFLWKVSWKVWRSKRDHILKLLSFYFPLSETFDSIFNPFAVQWLAEKLEGGNWCCSYSWRWSEVNFINILCTPFSYEGAFHSFSLIIVWFCNFWWKNIGAKAACKMLMKLTTEVNFINILFLPTVVSAMET